MLEVFEKWVGAGKQQKNKQKEHEIYDSPGELREIIPSVKRTGKDNQEVSDMGENVVQDLRG